MMPIVTKCIYSHSAAHSTITKKTSLHYNHFTHPFFQKDAQTLQRFGEWHVD